MSSDKGHKLASIVGFGGKFLTIILGLAAFVLGCIAIFSAETRKTYSFLREIETEANTLAATVSGPPWWKEEEDLFIAGSFIAFLACAANLIFTIVVKDPLDKAFDGFMQFLTALLVIFCALLLCFSATTSSNVSYLHLKSDVRFLSPKPGTGIGGGGGETIPIPSAKVKDSDREKFLKPLDNSYSLKIIAVAIALVKGVVLILLSLIICILPQRKKKMASPMFDPQPMMMMEPPPMGGPPPETAPAMTISTPAPAMTISTPAPAEVSQNQNTSLSAPSNSQVSQPEPRPSTATISQPANS